MKFFLILIFVSISSLGYSIDFKKKVDNCYSYNPHELSNEEIDKKSKLLDLFWTEVDKDTTKYLPLLRIELLAEGHKPFFYFNGSSLLLKNSKSKSDYEIVFKSIQKVDLRDIKGEEFLYKVNMLASLGFNTYEFANMILNAKKFNAFFDQYVLTLDKDYSLLFVLLPIQSDLYVYELIKRLDVENDLTNQKAIITILGYSCNCKSDSIIEKYINNKEANADLVQLCNEFKKSDYKTQNDIEFQRLTKKRNNAIQNRISGEAIDEINDLTIQIKQNYLCH